MIFDRLENHHLYTALGFDLPAALKFLLETDLGALPVGRLDLNADRLYALVQAYDTRQPDQSAWEAHRRYIDVQYMLSGRELMGFANLQSMQPGEYDPGRDFQSMSNAKTGIGNTIEVGAGQFVIFFPEDAHKPGLRVNLLPEPVKKIVLKVKI